MVGRGSEVPEVLRMEIFLFFILDQSPCYHIFLMVGWRRSNPITEATEKLESVPLMYMMR